MEKHPHIHTLYQLYLSEEQPFRKVHRMIDLFESIIKIHTVVILSSYVQHNKLSDAAKGMLAQGLRTPSLGTWQLFSRLLFEELQKDNFTWALTEFAGEFGTLVKALKADKTNVISFRNGYAHGATPSDDQCREDIKKFEPFLDQLLASKWLEASSTEEKEGKVVLKTMDGELSLHPVLLYRNENSEASFAFFNDLKNDKIGLLNYPLGKHYREKDFYHEFHKYLPLHEWKKSGSNEFYQRIEELTETFKGRTAERAQLLKFVSEKHKGYFSIQGNPGIGKSALIAQFFKDLRAHEEIKNVLVVEYFIRRGTAQAQIDYLLTYLIKRTDELFPQCREIRAEDKNTWGLQQQLFEKWRLWAEHSKGQKLLFLIDGLDEGVENNVVNYLPRENFDHVLIIYGSRPGGHKSIDELWTTLPAGYHTKLELNGLSREDIRALIYEVANKYEVERESAWIEAVQQRSQGNPLYLKLLCDALENFSIALNDVNALPKEIDEYYKAILDRYAQDPDGDALLAGLYTFAAAKDYLTMPHLGLINHLGEATVQRIGSTLKEVLYENPLTEEVLDYQLFHESFREYLLKEKSRQVEDASERIIDFCATWQDHEGTFEQRYALDLFAPHLSESKKEARAAELFTLFQNEAYTAEQKKILKQFDATRQLFQLVALVANNEIDLALKRIESFGGADEEGVKRRFILYMLCLMELTLLESKDKPFRKTAIEKLLKHLDEQLPKDHSILTWDEFFPSYSMFQMACECADLGLDYLTIYERTADWEKDWLADKTPFSELQFEVLQACATGISSDYRKSSALKDISAELAKQGKLEEAASAMQQALACATGISDDYLKSSALKDISAELAKHCKLEEAASAMQQALACATGISDESDKSSALKDISAELAKQGKLEEALACATGISDDYLKSSALKDISAELAKHCKLEEA
ncbi:MAG: NACHT domain-containing protein, partial [Cryomorphaceae bacterium]|nr:NACHT domain-containing protein [Cryomorphaceae bacterium]